MASTSLVVAAGAIPAAKFGWFDQSADMYVSAEHANTFSLTSRAIVLEGPRMARLEAMVSSLPQAAHELMLNLDATDHELIDIAAQQAGVTITRGARLANGAGMHAFITPNQRSLG